MADIEITDEASLEAWLKTRPRRDAEIIAFRAAARVFPLWGRAMEEPWALYAAETKKGDLTAIPLLRVILALSAEKLEQRERREILMVSAREAAIGAGATSPSYLSSSISQLAFKSIARAVNLKFVQNISLAISRVRTHSQNMTAAASAQADRNRSAHRS